MERVEFGLTICCLVCMQLPVKGKGEREREERMRKEGRRKNKKRDS